MEDGIEREDGTKQKEIPEPEFFQLLKILGNKK
jgi:hypothetical protein